MDEVDLHRDSSERERRGDNRPIMAMIENGVGTVVSRVMVVVVLPLVCAVAGFSTKVMLDNISLHIAEVKSSVDVLKGDIADIKLTVRQTINDANSARDNITRINQHMLDDDRRLNSIEDGRGRKPR